MGDGEGTAERVTFQALVVSAKTPKMRRRHCSLTVRQAESLIRLIYGAAAA